MKERYEKVGAPCQKCGAMLGHTLGCELSGNKVVRNDPKVILEAFVEGARRAKDGEPKSD